MKWAIAQGWRKDNPAENIAQALPKADKTKARRKALPYAEVAGCIATVHGSGASPATKLALEFLILTAARSGEVRGAVWSEIDMAAKVWEVPAVRMKMKRPHRVPLLFKAGAIEAALQPMPEAVPSPVPIGGRPRKAESALAAYDAIYPQGHRSAGDGWKDVERKVSERMGERVSADTIQRALNSG